MAPPETEQQRRSWHRRGAALAVALLVLGAAAWAVGAGYFSPRPVPTPATEAAPECDSCALRHQRLTRLRDLPGAGTGQGN